jgi:hypothetical protein
MAREGAGLRWSVVTIDDGDDAKSALDRITIPQDVLDRIAPTALPRSSIIISDEPLSEETNYRTEFVAVLSNHPQGGFITRERSNDVIAADEGFWRDRDPYYRDRQGSPYGGGPYRGGPFGGSPYGRGPYGGAAPPPFWRW